MDILGVLCSAAVTLVRARWVAPPGWSRPKPPPPFHLSPAVRVPRRPRDAFAQEPLKSATSPAVPSSHRVTSFAPVSLPLVPLYSAPPHSRLVE